jgi:transketolase
MLQYALLHLFGYALSMDDIKKFRVGVALAEAIESQG